MKIEEKLKQKNRLDKILIVLDIIGIVIGLLMIDGYVWLWVSAYYRVEAVASDFWSLRFWIMPLYFVSAIIFFLVSLKWQKKRIDYLIIGMLCWALLYVAYLYVGKYLMVFTLPFLGVD